MRIQPANTPHTAATREQLAAWNHAVAQARLAGTLIEPDPTGNYNEPAVDAALDWLAVAGVAGAESPRLVAFGL